MLVFSRRGGMWLHFCFFMISGAVALITLQQPPVVLAPLGRHAVLPCELQDSQDEKILNQPILYWQLDGKPLTSCDGSDEGRVKCLNQTSSNKPIELRAVQWSDGGTYECKMSIRTDRRGSFRLKGNRTTLVVYDAMTFNLTKHNGSLLRCEVNVSQDLGFAVTVTKDGDVLQSPGRAAGPAAARSRRLSRTVPLRGPGRYGCALQLEGALVTSRTFQSGPTDVERDPERPERPECSECPEPWFLYASLLLVPVLVLLVLLPVLLKCR